MPESKIFIYCNIRTDRSAARAGSKAAISTTNPGNGHERIKILVRSRVGRYVCKWEALKYLRNFRAKRIPESHPHFERIDIFDFSYRSMDDAQSFCAHLNEKADALAEK